MVEIEQQKTVEKLVSQYSFLSDAAFIELQNAINVLKDNNKESNNTFVDRIANLMFGEDEKRQHQINSDLILSIEALEKLDERRAKQLLQTQQGLKKTIKVLSALKAEFIDYRSNLEQTLTVLDHRVSDIEKGINIRDRIKTIINSWLILKDGMPAYFSLLMLFTQLKWDCLDEESLEDEDFKNWIKSEVLVAFQNKFDCLPHQLIPVVYEIKSVRSATPEILDAINLALKTVDNSMYELTFKVLFENSLAIKTETMPVISIERLTSSLLEGALL